MQRSGRERHTATRIDLWHGDLYGMSESIDREVSSIDGQDLIDGRIVVHDGKHDSVDKGERLIGVLRQYVPGLTICTPNSRADLKEVRGVVY